MINRVVLAGRPTRDLKLKKTNSGTSVCSFTLAVGRNFKNKNGEREADFINCIAWNKTADVMNQYVKRGSAIGVDGRIQTRSYDNKEGQRVYVTEVIVENFSFLGGSDQGNQVNNSNQSFNQSNKKFNPNGTVDPFKSNGGGAIDVTDDDLPF